MSFSPNLYKHELDQKAFDALSIFPKFVKLRKSYIANVDEKAAKINFLSSAIIVRIDVKSSRFVA